MMKTKNRNMNVNNYIKRQTLGYSAMLIIGLAALFTGFILKYEPHVMSGIVLGFLPVGIGGLAITLYSRNNPQMYRNIEIETDERNIFIRNRSGATAFWISFWYVCALTIFSTSLSIAPHQVGTYTLFFMSITYFIMLFINMSRY